MLIQNSIVAIAVIFCTFYAAWLLTPARPRLRAMQWILQTLPQTGNKPGLLRRIALKLTQKAAQRADKACGGCSPDRRNNG